MKALLVPLVLALVGLGVGAGAGIFLKPMPEKEEVAHPCGDGSEPTEKVVATKEPKDPEEENDYVKLNNQFIVPIVENDRVNSMVVLSLSLEVIQGSREAVFAREPKLRDAFLQVLFDHANTGGFSGQFTAGTKIDRLSNALKETSRGILGEIVVDVLVTDIVRQDG